MDGKWLYDEDMRKLHYFVKDGRAHYSVCGAWMLLTLEGTVEDTSGVFASTYCHACEKIKERNAEVEKYNGTINNTT